MTKDTQQEPAVAALNATLSRQKDTQQEPAVAALNATLSRQAAALAKMREKFPDGEVGYRPMPLIKKEEYDKLPKDKCKICGGYHATSKTGHLSYIGHAALTNRLLDADALWNWEPLSPDDNGFPRFDATGGLWIKLTIAGMTRIGYGNAEKMPYSEVGARDKSVIGDALRNAAMRFGAALEMWHKGTLGEPDPVFEYGSTEPTGKPAVTMPESAGKPVTEAVTEVVKPATAKASEADKQTAEKTAKDEQLAEEGEVKFIEKKLSALKVTDGDQLILDTIGTGTLDNLTKANFEKLKSAVKGKK